VPAKKATSTRNSQEKKKSDTKRKRFGKTGRDTRQAKASQRAAADTKQTRQARQMREVRSLAIAGLEALKDGDHEALRAKLTKIASLGDA
jgi:hypothetical protein